MNRNQRIIKNFQDYNLFLSSLNIRNQEVATSIKMMYAIHMETNTNKGFFFIGKQVLRFIMKFFSIPFVVGELAYDKKHSKDIIISNTSIENLMAKELNIALIDIRISIRLNKNANKIYKELFLLLTQYIKNKNLKKKNILLLLHRVIDYLIVYHTVDMNIFRTLLVENDRDPKNLALIHNANTIGIKTIKYDNWLIDPVNHNDVYCQYYFYPSRYHRMIIERCETNAKLKYIEGGFASWDKLNEYKIKSIIKMQRLIYFTQFNIDINHHMQYIEDIVKILESIGESYILSVKVHPREEISKYEKVLNISPYIELIDKCDDIYELISSAKYCFSIFSTISIEAKHIIKDSYFINYYTKDSPLVDYIEIGLDIVENKEQLKNILSGTFSAVDQNIFIENNNCRYPNTLNRLQEILNEDR